MPRSVALLCHAGDPAYTCVNTGSFGFHPDARAAAQVREVLKPGEFRLMTCRNWHGFRRCAATTHAAVIVAPRLSLDSSRSGLRETSRDDFPCPLILVTNGGRENLRYLGPIRVIDVVFVDEVKRRLAQVLTSVALTDGRVRLRAAIQRREMHLTLKRALLKLVDLPLPDPGWDPKGGRRFPRTAKDLATLVDLSTDYLRQLATEARLPLGRIMHGHVALRALEMFAAGVREEIVAERLGYESTRGVHALITRNFEMNAAEILSRGLHQCYAETASLIAAPPTIVTAATHPGGVALAAMTGPAIPVARLSMHFRAEGGET